MLTHRLWIVIALGLSCLGLAGLPVGAQAQAQPVVQAQLIAGLTSAIGEFPGRHQGLGVGARVGMAWPDPAFFLGGLALYHLGSDTESLGSSPETTGHTRSSSFLLGPELGYDFVRGVIVLRGLLGLGLYHQRSRGLNRETLNAFHASPGLGLLIPIDHLTLGLEARYTAVASGRARDQASGLLSVGVQL